MRLIFSISVLEAILVTWINGDCEPFSTGVSKPRMFFMSLAGPSGPYAGDITKDVTVWCVKPGSSDFQQTFSNDPGIRNKINFDLPISFLIHGFTDSFKRNKTGWMEPTALIWANTQSTNVCVIDWHALALYNFMLTAETHTWLVAEYASYFVRYLVTLGAILENIVVAGHSLGANIAGFLGKLLGSGQLGMILGLDPPGYIFGITDSSKRLDVSDAKFVQIMHTSLFGFFSPVGHASFLPNFLGGFQPGCGLDAACSHGRAIYYFIVSLLYPFKGSAIQCSGLFNCYRVEDVFGPRAARRVGVFHLTTGSCFPYIAL